MVVFDDVDVIKEVGNDDVRLIFIRDDQNFLVESLFIKGFNEEKYKKLRRYVKEKLGEEFTGIVSLDTGKALTKVLLLGMDQVGQSIVNDVINVEEEKFNSWISNGVLKELIDKVNGEVSSAKKKSRKSRKRKSKKTKKSKKKSEGTRKRSRKKKTTKKSK